ncbi:MAG: helix-turn-helix domain-containing protein [Caulobacteraceae bacterium]|nr:helix-turn-helix domain-containing protein [Caulobacteraceae bacterium]
MVPLDAGSESETYAVPARDDFTTASLNDAATLGEGLRAARDASMRTLDQLADATRVRAEYLKALEENAWSLLPSRPFTLGYVRAYARALGLDEEAAADRFKAEYPDNAEKLQAPVGSELADVKKRSPWLLAVVAVAVIGVVAWNVTQRILTADHQAPSSIAEAPGTWKEGEPLAVIPVSAPLPAPADQTVPAPYITPGLDPEAQAAAMAAQTAPVPPGPQINVGAAFNPKGAIYGAAPNQSGVTIQARKPANIVVRNGDGSVVYFARQLAAGEAWRAPLTGNMVVDVSDPIAFAVYLNGEYHGSLPASVTQVGQLNNQAAQSQAQAARAAAQAAAAAAKAQAQQAAQPDQATPAAIATQPRPAPSSAAPATPPPAQ